MNETPCRALNYSGKLQGVLISLDELKLECTNAIIRMMPPFCAFYRTYIPKACVLLSNKIK